MSKTPLSDIYGGAQNFLQLQGRYLQLKYARAVAEFASRALRTLVTIAITCAALLFFSVALALWFGELLGSLPAGFACVGAFYLLCLVLWNLVSSGRAGNFRDTIVRELDLGVSSYEGLLREQTQLKPRLEEEKKNLLLKLEELKQAIADIEQKFGGGEGRATQDNQGEQVGSRVLSTAVNVLLDVFVMPKVGIVKRAVIPLVANTVMRSKFFRSGKLGNLIRRLKGNT